MFISKKSDFLFRNDILALRGFAFILVFIFHLYPDLMVSGFIGVDVFFVISGFVITNSVFSRDSSSFIEFTKKFFWKRFLRLFPALGFTIISTFVLLALLIPASPFKSFAEFNLTGISSLFGLSNVFLERQALDYFGDITHLNPFLQTWSLSVEFQFYLIFPLIVLLGALLRRGGVSRGFEMIMLVLSAASLSIFIGNGFLDSYFSSIARFWELGVGCLIGSFPLLVEKLANKGSQFSKILGPLLFLFLAAESFFSPSVFTIPLAVLAASSLIIFRQNSRLICNSFFENTGKPSYSLYLWHWPIICFCAWTFNFEGFLRLAFVTSLLLVIAPLCYHWFEVDFKSWLSAKARSFWAPIGLYLLVVLASFSALAAAALGKSFYIGEKRNLDVDELAWDYPPLPLDDSSSNQSEPRIVVVGNSHARHLLPMLEVFSEDHNYKLHYNEYGTKHFRSELSFLGVLPSLVSRMNSDDILVVSSKFFSELESEMKANPESAKILRNKWSLVLKGLENAENSPHTVFFLKSPRFKASMPYLPLCFEEVLRPNPADCEMKGVDVLGYRQSQIFPLIKSSSLGEKISIINMLDVLCAGSSDCSSVRDGKILFRDSTHLSREGSFLFYSHFSRVLNHGS